jgi:hypothetical protein
MRGLDGGLRRWAYLLRAHSYNFVPNCANINAREARLHVESGSESFVHCQCMIQSSRPRDAFVARCSIISHVMDRVVAQDDVHSPIDEPVTLVDTLQDQQQLLSERRALASPSLHQNAHVLPMANRCPPEILAHIILLCRPECWVRNAQAFRDYLRLTHVCQHWRMSALAHASLWNLVPAPTALLTDLLLARAQGMNLIVTSVGQSYGRGRRRRDVWLLKAMSRLQALGIASDPQYLYRALQDALRTPAPELRAFRVHVDIKLDDHLFAGHMPRLRMLELRGCSMPWRAPWLAQLSSLTLWCPPNGHRAQQLLDFLSSMPMLEDLSLYMAIQMSASSDEHSQVVVLARLTRLHIVDHEFNFPRVLASLETPNLRRLSLEIQTIDGHDVRALSESRLVESYLSHHGSSFRSCDVLQFWHGFQLVAFQTAHKAPLHINEDLSHLAVFHLHITVGYHDGPRITVDSAGAVSQAVNSMDGLQEVGVRIGRYATQDIELELEPLWEQFFISLPDSVQRVYMFDTGGGCAVDGLEVGAKLTAGMLRALASLTKSANALPLPGLEQLTLRNARINDRVQPIGDLLEAFFRFRNEQDAEVTVCTLKEPY